MARKESANGDGRGEREDHRHLPQSDRASLTDDELRALTRELAKRLAGSVDSPLLYIFCPEDVQLAKEHAVTIYTLLREQKTNLPSLHIFIHSGGGDIAAAYDIISLACQYTDGNVTAIVPLYAMSAATLIGIGADGVIMSKIGKLGPLDSQIFNPRLGYWVPVRAVTDVPRVLEQELHKFEGRGTGLRPDRNINIKAQTIIKPMADQVDPYLLAAHARSGEGARKYGERVMSMRKAMVAPERVSKCLQHLTVGYPIHGFELDLMELKESPLFRSVVNSVPAAPAVEQQMMDFLTTLMALEQKHQEMGEPLSAPLIDLIRPTVRHPGTQAGRRRGRPAAKRQTDAPQKE